MKKILFFKVLLATSLVLTLIATISIAGEFPTNQVEAKLSLQTARLIQGPKGHILLNQGHCKGIQKGDLWTVYLPAQSVKDPETGKTLGKFSPPAAIARVVKVHDRLSEVELKCIKERDCQISSGMKAVRFDRIKAWFMDKNRDSSETYTQLRTRLDHLNWQGYKQPSKYPPDSNQFAWDVVIVASKDKLVLWSGGQILEICQLEESRSVTTQAKDVKNLPGMDSPLKVSGFDSMVSLDRKVEHMGLARSSSSKTPYLVFLSKRSLKARNLKNNKTFTYEYPGFGQVVGLSVAGNQMLAVNIYDQERGMQSMLLEITDTGFQKKATGIPYVLSFMGGIDNSKGPELWGQQFSPSQLLLPVVYRLKISNDSVTKEQRIDVPFGFSLIGAFSGDLNGNGKTEIGFFNPAGKLALSEQGVKIWESTGRFAPAHGFFLVSDPLNPDAAPSKVSVWGQPSLFHIKNRICAALPLNKTSLYSIIDRGPGQGTVGLFFSQKKLYRLQRLTDSFQGSIQDLAVYKDKLLICVAQGNSFSSEKGQTHVISLPLSHLSNL